MRIGSSTLNQNKTISKKNIIRGIVPSNFKNFNQSLFDTFNILNAWTPTRGTWSTNGNTLSTSTSSSSYPIITSFDIRSQNITANMSLDTAGPGVVFWLQDQDNWWAGITYYIQSVESYNIRQVCTRSEDYNTGICYACSCPGGTVTYGAGPCCGSPCGGWGNTGTRCVSYGFETGPRNVYRFYIKLLKSENGIVTDITNILLRTTCNASSDFSPCTVSQLDNITGIEISTLDNVITVRAKDDFGSFYGSSISYTAPSPNRGYKSGIIFSPGSNYQESSNVQDISIVGN